MTLPQGKAVASVKPDMGVRFRLALSLFQWGRFSEVLERGSTQSPARLCPLAELERSHASSDDATMVSRNKLPAIWALHGWQNSAVPAIGMCKFLTRVKSLYPNTPVLLDLGDEDHGFDEDLTAGDEIVRRGTDFVRKYWIA